MTYADTAKLVSALNDIETWSVASRDELAKPSKEFDTDTYNRYKRWLDDAKQEVFDLVSK